MTEGRVSLRSGVGLAYSSSGAILYGGDPVYPAGDGADWRPCQFRCRDDADDALGSQDHYGTDVQ